MSTDWSLGVIQAVTKKEGWREVWRIIYPSASLTEKAQRWAGVLNIMDWLLSTSLEWKNTLLFRNIMCSKLVNLYCFLEALNLVASHKPLVFRHPQLLLCLPSFSLLLFLDYLFHSLFPLQEFGSIRWEEKWRFAQILLFLIYKVGIAEGRRHGWLWMVWVWLISFPILLGRGRGGNKWGHIPETWVFSLEMIYHLYDLLKKEIISITNKGC